MSVVELFKELLLAYFFDAWLFALLHLVVVGLIVHQIVRINREVKTLDRFPDIQSKAIEQYELVALLDQFRNEATQLGKQGLLVPMTDFSDRLDAAMEEIMGKFRDLVNLLLTIGIAGTMFGVFEFAFRSQAVVGPEGANALALGQFLAESMAKAFPVGFIGLLLMFVGQVIAGHYENKLQVAIARATREALNSRAEAVRSQALIIQEATQAIKEGLAPLSDLRQTLTDSINPIVESLAGRLDEAIEIIRAQVNQVQETTDRLHEAEHATREILSAMQQETGKVRELLQLAPEVFENTREIQDQQRDALATYAEMISKLSQDVSQVARQFDITFIRLEGLPGEILDQVKANHDELQRVSIETWRTISEEHGKQLADSQSRILKILNEQAASLQNQQQTTLDTFSEKVKSLLLNIDGISDRLDKVFSQFKSLPAIMKTQMEDAITKFQEEATGAWRDLADLVGRDVQGALTASLDDTEKRVKVMAENLEQAAQNLASFAMTARNDLVDAVGEALGRTEEQIELILLKRYPDAIEQIKEMTQAIKNITGELRRVHDQVAKMLKETKEDRRDIRETVKEIRISKNRIIDKISDVDHQGETDEMKRKKEGLVKTDHIDSPKGNHKEKISFSKSLLQRFSGLFGKR